MSDASPLGPQGPPSALGAPSAPLPPLESAVYQRISPDTSAGDRQRGEDFRTVVYLMLFRLVLASVLLLGAVSLAVSNEDPQSLSRTFARFLFGLLGTAYLSTLVYAMLLRRVRELVRFAYVQIAADLALIAILVHATGGAQSVFTILFMIEVIAVALLPERYGAAYVAVASAVLFLIVASAGYYHVLP